MTDPDNLDPTTMVLRAVAPAAQTGDGPPTLIIRTDDGEMHRFTEACRLGRGEECGLRLASADVSRCHAEVFPEGAGWRVRDLDSTNGTLLDGIRIEAADLPAHGSLQLGPSGPVLEFEVEGAEGHDGMPSMSYFVRRYVDADGDGPVGRRTRMIREAVARQRVRQRIVWMSVVAVAVAALGAVVLYALHQRAELERQRVAAEEIFYVMKDLELQLEGLADRLAAGDDEAAAALRTGRERLADLQHSYDRFLEEMGIFGDSVSEERRLTLRMVRVFGECEVAMPPGLSDAIDRHLEAWRADTRLTKALERARSNGYIEPVVRVLEGHNLPPQLFYVALQESDFRLDACGPETRFGIAKGPWQMIPSTARAYGLKTGPLYLLRRPDPEDERHDLARSTDAAARFLRDLYLRETKGSGMLAIAAYNWGGSNVRKLIRTMPEDPRQRNFWHLLLEHRQTVPKETWGYVFRILTAAIIGERPDLFGFDFEPPLAAALADPKPPSDG